MTKGILAEISPEPLKASLAPNGLDRNPSRCRQRNITSRREQGEFGDVAAISGLPMIAHRRCVSLGRI